MFVEGHFFSICTIRLLKMQHIHVSFAEFLQKHFLFLGIYPSNKDVIKCAVEAVRLGLLDKDCVNMHRACLAVVLIEYAIRSVEQEGCMPFLHEFFDMKPCLRKVLAALPHYQLYGNRFAKLCMSFDYFWTDRLAVQQYWWAMPMDVREKWSPCRVAWIWAVTQ